MRLQYAVITSVDRDDLADGGASIFADTILQTRDRVPDCRIEGPHPGFPGHRVVSAHGARRRPRRPQPQHRNRPAALSHGTVRRKVSALAGAARSLAEAIGPDIATKTGIMVGLGEEHDELLSGIRRSACGRSSRS
jgi:lipoic acid synthetase